MAWVKYLLTRGFTCLSRNMIQKQRPIDLCMLHVNCSYLSGEKWHKIRSAAVWDGKSNWVITSTE